MTDIIERLRSYRGPWLVPAEAADEIERLRGERDAAVKAMSGWSGYGYRDGYYVDDIGEYFQPFIDAARGEK